MQQASDKDTTAFEQQIDALQQAQQMDKLVKESARQQRQSIEAQTQ